MFSTRPPDLPNLERPARTGVQRLARSTASSGLLALLLLLATALAAPAAQAGGPAPQTAPVSCGYTAFEQPFQNWGDSDYYLLAPSGSFEAGAPDWTLSGGAAVGSPGSPIVPASSGYALALPAGSSATTPPICVDSGSPYSRMFAYTTVRNFKQKSTLKVDLIYTDNSGRLTTKQVGVLPEEPYWDATQQLTLPKPVTIRPDANGSLSVRYRFTPLYSTAWKIDDLYVDPRKH